MSDAVTMCLGFVLSVGFAVGCGWLVVSGFQRFHPAPLSRLQKASTSVITESPATRSASSDRSAASG